MSLHAARQARPSLGTPQIDPILWSLEKDQGWYEDLVQKSRDLLCVHDLEGRLLSVNAAAALALEYNVEELLRIPLRELVAPEFRPQYDDYLKAIAREGESQGLMMVVTRSGQRRVWKYHNSLRTEGVPAPVVRGKAYDVTEQKQTEWELRKSEERYRSVIAALAEGVVVVEAGGRLVSSNQSAERILGVKSEELAGIMTSAADWEPYTIREDGSPFPAYEYPATVTLRTGQPQNNVCMGLRREEGPLQWLLLNSQPLCRRGEDKPYAAVVSFSDVTERRQAEERLSEYEKVVESLEEMIVVVDRNHRYSLANRSFLKYRGMEREQLIGRHINEILHKESLEGVREKLDECFRGKVVQYEMKYRYPNLGERDLSISYFPIEGANGVDHAACVLRDITERKEGEENLRKSEELYRSVVTAMAEGVLLRDAGGKILACNQSFERLVGMTREELVGTTAADWEHLTIHEDGARFPGIAQPSEIALRTGKPQSNVRMGIRKPDGSLSWASINAQPMTREGENKPYAVLTTFTDITEQKQADEALRRSEAELKEAQRVARMGGWRIDVASGEVTWSDELHRMIGQDASSRVSSLHGIQRFLTPESWDALQKSYRRILETGERGHGVEVEFYRADGTTGWVILRGALDLDATGKVIGMHGGALDITDRKRADQALRESEERLRLAQSAAKIGMYERNLRTGISQWGPETEEMYGVLPGAVPKSLEGFLDLVHSDDRPQVMRILEESLRTGDGKGEWRVTWPDGTVHWIAGRWRVFMDQEGRPARLIGIDYDITERKHIEEELRLAKEKLSEEKLYLEQEIDTELGFEEIIGRSPALKAVMEKVSKVAGSNATVLLLGETGTGKELVARALHRLSSRRGSSFIKMNCAAIPTGLLESELFGHEKGAFTGAVARKIGRLELADKGTLFLDEIGEISLTLQPKLLRVLQDMEFERLGGTQTLRVDFRLIAATNRDLAKSVGEREFRSDLYYRLNVFPIRVPPLRERREDIRMLAEHFVQKFANRMGKSITSIPKKTIDTLMQWEWPGNVRELENFIERSVILTHGSVLVAPLSELAAPREINGNGTLEAAEREHILRALRESGGRISGRFGAAERLGLKRTTLQSKLRQMGIDHRKPVDGN